MKNILLLICCLFLLASIAVRGQSYIPETDQPKMKVKPVVEIKAYAFNLNDIELLDSPFKNAMEADVAFLKWIEPDKLLSQFRSHAGLEPKAPKYKGWESLGLAGHSLGHYLSACSMHYAVTGEEDFLVRVNYIVDELAECQKARKTGYVGAIPNEDNVFQEVSKGNIRSRGFDLNGAWAPWYTIHKIMAGLMDAYLYCDNEKALQVNIGIADWAENTLKDLNYDQIQKMLRCEYGGMNEALTNTYALTGQKKYLDLSLKFHDNFVLDSLAMEINILPGKHSNTQVPKVIGTVRRYQVDGKESDYTIGKFFWQTMVNHHTYSPGGNSNYEYLGAEDELNDKLTYSTMETCNTHNMLKLTRHLFALDPSALYMDYYERALYNHILASQNREDGMMCYFVPLRMGAKKTFSTPDEDFTCCVGTGMENHVKYGESIYYQGKDGSLYVNLFIPSILTWKEKKVTVKQESDFPEESTIHFTIQTERSVEFPLLIRKPDWVVGEVSIVVNGTNEPGFSVNESGYISIRREWKNGDQLDVDFSMNIHTIPMPDNDDRISYFYGPVLLAGNLGEKEPEPSKGIPVFVTNESDPNQWLTKSVEDGLVFQTANVGNPKDITFQPFYTFYDDYYSVYWDQFDTEEWKVQQEIYEKERAIRADLEARTVDLIRLGEMQPERDHELAGDETEVGESHTRKWRSANTGGYFSFDLKVSPNDKQELICTYWGMDNRGRNFDILVNEKILVTVDLNQYKDSRFYEISYPLPTDLTQGKEKVTVLFKPHEGNTAGPIYSVRVVKVKK